MEQRARAHILEEHPELRDEREAIMDAVAKPDLRHSGHEDGELWFYVGGVGPTRWIKVVVHYDQGHGSITTAFPRRAFP